MTGTRTVATQFGADSRRVFSLGPESGLARAQTEHSTASGAPTTEIPADTPIASQQITVRSARPGDLPAIMALEVEAFGSGGWSEAAWQEELDRAGQGVHIACLPDGRPAGVIALTAVFETADLLRVMVAPTVRCQGLGRTLVEAGLIWARERGAERLLLEVAATNAPARHLYSRLGFTTIDRRRDYYGAGTDALIMSRNCEEDRRV